RNFDGRMDVYSVNNPAIKWYTGRIRATTVYAGVYRVSTPAGVFRAALIKTEYQIDIFAVVSVRDTLYTFYAEGVGKVAEAEHRRIAAMGLGLGLFNTDTKIGKLLVSYAPVSRPSGPGRIASPWPALEDAHGVRSLLSHAARRGVERAERLRLGPCPDARRRIARLFVRVDRRAPLQRLRPLPRSAGARVVRRGAHDDPAAR